MLMSEERRRTKRRFFQERRDEFDRRQGDRRKRVIEAYDAATGIGGQGTRQKIILSAFENKRSENDRRQVMRRRSVRRLFPERRMY